MWSKPFAKCVPKHLRIGSEDHIKPAVPTWSFCNINRINDDGNDDHDDDDDDDDDGDGDGNGDGDGDGDDDDDDDDFT